MSLYKKYRAYLTLLGVVIVSSIVVWIPFIQQLSVFGVHIPNTNTDTIYRNFDGLLYILAAKSMYSPQALERLPTAMHLAPVYFAAHLPLYPILIRICAVVLGYLKSMMVVNVVATIGYSWVFYHMLKRLALTQHPLILTIVSLFLPRFLVIRSVGAPESLFMMLVVLSLYWFERDRIWAAGLAGGLATMTKLPGIILLVAYAAVYIERYLKKSKIKWSTLGIVLIPAGLLAVCGIYALQYHDFFAYWHTGYVVPMPYPFAAFNYQAKWVGTAWLEEVVLYFALYTTASVYMYKSKYRSLFYTAGIFTLSLFFVQHRDISRYGLPVWPLACIAFERFLTDRRTLIALGIVLPAVYMYAWNFMQTNVMPVANWAPFM